MSFKTDAEIAQSSTMRPIGEIAAKLGLNVDNIEPYGHYKAKNQSCRGVQTAAKTRPSDFGYRHQPDSGG